MIAAGYWALAVVIISIVFMFAFRGSIDSLLGRTKKVGKDGLEAFSSEQPTADAGVSDAVAVFNENFMNQLLLKIEGTIEADLTTRSLSEPSSAKPVLIRSLAANQILNAFLRITAAVFISQIDFLVFLNSQVAPVSVDAGRPFFQSACERFPFLEQASSFEAWFDYMVTWDLVVKNDSSCEISLIGREYLKWRLEERVVRPLVG